jgi:hypothetical protein
MNQATPFAGGIAEMAARSIVGHQKPPIMEVNPAVVIRSHLVVHRIAVAHVAAFVTRAVGYTLEPRALLVAQAIGVSLPVVFGVRR